MRALILPVFLASCLLSACDAKLTAGDAKHAETGLSYSTVELKRQGGSKCPGDPGFKAEEALCANVKFTYPKINSDSKPELAATLNAYIHQQLLDSIGEDGEPTPPDAMTLESYADNFIQEYKQDPNTFTSWEMERSASVLFNTDKLITLQFDEYGYTGGAHPFSGTRYAVLNLQDGKPLELADLLNPGYEAALNVEGEKAFWVARDLPESSSLEEQGFSFENNVFMLNDNFGVDKEGLRFIFNSYEVAPYAMGPTELMIPYEDIYSLIRPEGLLGNLEK